MNLIGKTMAPNHMNLHDPVIEGPSLALDISLDLSTDFLRGVIQLKDEDSYHFLSGKYYQYVAGDFYFGSHEGEGKAKFWANNMFQGGIIDLGNIGRPSLDQVMPPVTGYNRFGVDAVVVHTYVSPAKQGEEGHYVIFRVKDLKMGQYVEIELGSFALFDTLV